MTVSEPIGKQQRCRYLDSRARAASKDVDQDGYGIDVLLMALLPLGMPCRIGLFTMPLWCPRHGPIRLAASW
jgi:hypothetical protein